VSSLLGISNSAPLLDVSYCLA